MGTMATLSVTGTPAGVSQAGEALRVWVDQEGLPAAARHRLLTVLDEVLSNVVRHGTGGQTGTIDVQVVSGDGWLEARVADDAAPFNLLLVPPPDTSGPLEERTPGGLGIALVRALADEVRYERAGGRNQLTMRWRLEARRT